MNREGRYDLFPHKNPKISLIDEFILADKGKCFKSQLKFSG